MIRLRSVLCATWSHTKEWNIELCGNHVRKYGALREIWYVDDVAERIEEIMMIDQKWKLVETVPIMRRETYDIEISAVNEVDLTAGIFHSHAASLASLTFYIKHSLSNQQNFSFICGNIFSIRSIFFLRARLTFFSPSVKHFGNCTPATVHPVFMYQMLLQIVSMLCCDTRNYFVQEERSGIDW